MNRKCGSCTLCCKLLPVQELNKAANTRCAHQRHTGCRVYHKPGFPMACGLWNCMWLIDERTASLSRPDRAGYVIDMMPEYVEVLDNSTGETRNQAVVQIWVDPSRRDAHHDPALRQYVAQLAETGVAALVRYGNDSAFLLVAPALCVERQWVEIHAPLTSPEHTVVDILNVCT